LGLGLFCGRSVYLNRYEMIKSAANAELPLTLNSASCTTRCKGVQGDMQMMQGYPKPWQSYQMQLDLLMARGMVVTDQPKALEYLERIGYYRLSGYWFAFRERTELCCPLDQQARTKPTKTKPTRLPLDSFKPGTTF
jgi:hypothetical protein